MARVTVATWRWGEKYGPEYVERLSAGVARNLARPHDFRVLLPALEDEYLTAIPGCFARLRMFDPEWARQNGLEVGDRVLVLDLDLIVTGSLDDLLEGDEPFKILQGVNSSNPGKFNGSVWRLDIGYRPDVWTDFSLEAAAQVPYFEFPDDQAWMEAKLPDAGAFGPESGVYAFNKPGWLRGKGLPANARIVAFPGWRDPAGIQALPWVRQHWLGEKVAA